MISHPPPTSKDVYCELWVYPYIYILNLSRKCQVSTSIYEEIPKPHPFICVLKNLSPPSVVQNMSVYLKSLLTIPPGL